MRPEIICTACGKGETPSSVLAPGARIAVCTSLIADLPQTADSNIPPNIALGTGCTDFVNDLVRLQAEAAGDDFFLDLGGAAEDRLDAAVGPEAADPVLAHVTVAAVQLHAPVGDAVAQLGVPPFDHRRLFGAQPVGAVLGNGAVGELARHRDLGGHLGQQELAVLELADRLAERVALLAVGD